MKALTMNERWRAAILVVLCTFMFIGPFYRQVLYGKVWFRDVFKAWRMYSGYGLEHCSAEFYTGDGTPIDRLGAIYGYTTWREAKSRHRNIRNPLALDDEILKLRRLGFPEVYVDAKCARTRGWKQVYTPDEEQCAQVRDRRRERRMEKRAKAKSKAKN